MLLRSLEEAAAEQIAQEKEAALAAAGILHPPAEGAPQEARIVPGVAGSRSGEQDEEESGSDDSGSELPQAPVGHASALPRTFEEFKRHWGTRLKDVAAHYGVPESGLSKVHGYRPALPLMCYVFHSV